MGTSGGQGTRGGGRGGEGAASTVEKVNNHFFAFREGIQKLRLLRDRTQDSVRSWMEVETESTGAAMLIGIPA
jgi:hypothetical protein